MSSRSLGSLTLDLTARIGGFERGMDKAARSADKRMQQIEASAKRAGKIIGTALVAGFGIAAAGIQSAINRMDEMSKAAQRVQMPTEQFSQLAYAGQLADVSMEDLQTSLGRLTKAQGDSLRATSEQARIFDRLGIATLDPLTGKLRNTRDVFLDFADAFKKNQGSPEIMAAGMAIFGRSFQNLIPLLKDGKEGLQAAADEADRLGVTISTQAGQQAEEFNDNLTRLKAAVSGLAVSVASELLPDLVNLTRGLQNLSSDGSTAAKIADSIRTAFSLVSNTFSWTADRARELGIAFGYLTEAAAGYWEIQKNIASFGLAEGSIAEGSARIRNAGQVAQDMVDEVRKKGPAKIDIVFAMDGKEPAGLFKPRQTPMGGLDLTPTPKTGGAKKAGKSDAAREARELEAALRELARAEQEAMRASLEAEAVRSRAIEDWAQITAQLRGPLAVAELDHIRHLQDIERTGKAAGESLASIAQAQEAARAAHLKSTDALKQYQDALANPELVEALDNVRWMTRGFFTDLVDGSGSALDAFKKFFDGIAGMIADMIAQQWAEQLFGKPGTTGKGTSGGNFFASLFGALKASGGRVSPGRFYEVNEQGTEMFTAGGRDYLMVGAGGGDITPAHRVGGGFNQVLNFALAAPTDPRTQQQIADRAMFHGQQAARRNR